MSYFEAAILGIVQGLTEYFPVSSSGHLVLVQELLGFNHSGLIFEIVVHLGSLLAVVIYFRNRLKEMLISVFSMKPSPPRTYVGYLILATIPAVIVGLSLEDFFDRMFNSPHFTSIFLLVTGLILFSTRFAQRGNNQVSRPTSLIIGLAQACAILPGVSRSGSTISAGIWTRVEPAKAAEFSFLLSIPAIAGAAVLKSKEFSTLSSDMAGPYFLGFIFSFIFSLAAIHWILAIIRKGRLDIFAYYCFAAGGFGLYLFSK